MNEEQHAILHFLLLHIQSQAVTDEMLNDEDWTSITKSIETLKDYNATFLPQNVINMSEERFRIVKGFQE